MNKHIEWVFNEWEKNPLPEIFLQDKSNAIFSTKEGIARQLATIKQFPAMIFVALLENNDIVIKKVVVNGEKNES